jgi:predicted DNA repair protein MutK
LSIAGTAAMFLVGGGILVHGIGPLHHAIEGVATSLASVPAIGGVLHVLGPMVANALIGVAAGAAVLMVVKLARRMWPARATAH